LGKQQYTQFSDRESRASGHDGQPSPRSTTCTDRGVYGISVAAELSGVPAQSLRLWERHGLLTPARSDGGTRRYSTDDLARLQRITVLVAAGVNIAGISRILNLEDDNTALRATHTSAPPTPHRSNAHSPPVRPHRPAPGAVRRGG
jgi:MerR family transcriptional regulator, heat shock protein HspR